MRLLEIAFCLIALAFLVAHNVRGLKQQCLPALFAAGVAIVALSAWLDQLRWQMAPAYLLFAILSLWLLKRSHAHVAVRSVGAILGIAVLGVGVLLSLGLPMLTLPAPAGPHVVGATSLSLVDESRNNAFFDAPNEPRELYVQIWYPGVLAENQPEPQVRTLWEELYRGEQDRFTVFTRYLRGVRTHSYRDIALSPSQPTYAVILFSHAIASFAEQSTLLMEHLASHGYVVVALSHPYASMRAIGADGRVIYPNLEKINAISAEFDAANAELAPRIAQAGDPAERASLQLEAYERASGLNELTETWVHDLAFVLDSIATRPERHPKLSAFSGRIDADRIGLLGMSFGGAAVTEFCKADARCAALLNMDGGSFGHRQRQPVQVPYLALLRADREDHVSPASVGDSYAITVAGTQHLDFTDDTVVLPILKWLGMNGPIAGDRAIEITNAVALRFFDAYLRDGPEPRFDGEFAELTVVTKHR